MEIPIQDVSTVIGKSRCGQTKHQKYGAYMKILEEKPEILEFLFENIDKSPNQEILIKAVDIAPELGPHFKELGETAIHWGLKFSLYIHGIFLSTTTSTDKNPKTGKGYLLLRLRRSRPTDKLSEELSKHLEPADSPDVGSSADQCAISTYML